MMAKMYASQEEMKAIHADRNSLKEEAMWHVYPVLGNG
jgi:hypothetical protein